MSSENNWINRLTNICRHKNNWLTVHYICWHYNKRSMLIRWQCSTWTRAVRRQKRRLHSKCCIGGFRETGLALVIVLRCDWPLCDIWFKSYEHFKIKMFLVQASYRRLEKRRRLGALNKAPCRNISNDFWIFSSSTLIPFVSPTSCFQIVRRQYHLWFSLFKFLSLFLLKAW